MQNTENTTNNPGEKLPSDEQLRQTVERVLGRADAAAQTTIYPESTGSPAQRRVLDTRAREISDNQREHSEFDGDRKTSPNAAHYAESPGSPPNSTT